LNGGVHEAGHELDYDERPRRGNARRIFAVAMILVLLLVSIVVVVEIARDGSSKSRPPDAAPVAGTGVVPVKDLPARSEPAVAWTGDRLFIYGGRKGMDPGRFSQDGALLDVMTGETVALPDTSFAGPFVSPTAVRAGNEVLVFGVECEGFSVPEDSDSVECEAESGKVTVATYDLDEGEWSTIPVPPDVARATASGSTFVTRWPRIAGVADQGAVVVDLGADAISGPDFWMITPATRQWRHLGSPGRATNSCMIGNEVAVVTGKYENHGRVVESDPSLSPGSSSHGPGDGWVQPTVQLLDITASDAQWHAGPTLTDVKYSLDPAIACMGNRVMVSAGLGGPNGPFRVYDTASRRWSTPPPTPGGAPMPVDEPIWTGTELLLLSLMPDLRNVQSMPDKETIRLQSGLAYNPASNTWRTIPPLPTLPHNLQWAGTAVVDYTPNAVRYTPG
jgi:hypothetical protein